jgi:P4 family phage/plasmid primase-like protien
MNLIELLGKYKATGENEKTHTIIPNLNNKEYKYGGTYSFPNDLVKESCDMFYKYFIENKGTLSITEAIPQICPLYIDLDLEFDGSSKLRQYNPKTIDLLVEFINREIRNNMDFDGDIECYVQEKEEPKTNDEGFVIKEGLHILYPKIIGDFKVFNEFFRILSSSKIDHIFDTCETYPINDLSKIFDTQVKRWFIYGSGKVDGKSYKVTNVYINNDIIDTEKTDRELLELFYLTKKFEKNITYKNNLENSEELMKPSKSSQGLNILDDNYDIEELDFDPEEEEAYSELKDEMQKDKRDMIKRIVLECFSEERSDNYENWLKVGMALKNTSRGLFDVFHEFSKKSVSYESLDQCQSKWESFNHCSNPITEATLRFWARLDNNYKYEKIMEESMTELIDKSVREGGAHDDIAKVVYNYYKDKFVCVEIRGNIWYHFDGTKWCKCSQGYLLQAQLPVKIKIMYSNSQGRFRKLQNKRLENGEPESEDIKKNEEVAGKIYNKLKDVPFQKNIMEACKNKFYNDKFQEDLDSNTKLLCFENCVFDLGENILREGRPEDKLSITTKYNLPIKENELPMDINVLWKSIELRNGIDKKDWDKSSKPSKSFIKTYMGIKDFLMKVLPDLDIEETPGEIRDYCIKYMAGRLCGEVMNRFSIWTGSGGNGKSILIDLLRQAMGGYCMNLPVTILTQKRKSSNAACPEKARTRGARLCYMQEPDENETINAGEMKELSGGDMILARNLYQEPFEFKPQFELVLMCNDKPKIEDKTNGAWRRVAVSPFNSRFVDRKEEIDHSRHVFKADKQLTDKVKHWGIVFMGMLLRQWVDLDCLNIEVPKSIRMETQNYKNQNDYIGQWFNECVEPEPDDTTPFKDLCSCYQNWLDVVYGKNIRLDINSLKERLISWQKSKYGFSDGINGSMTNPKINMKIKDEN